VTRDEVSATAASAAAGATASNQRQQRVPLALSPAHHYRKFLFGKTNITYCANFFSKLI